MKTKTKMIVMVEIVLVLCSVLLVAIPAIAAEQTQTMQKASANTITTASEDDYVLGVYGNANEDDTIDMGDVVYTKLAIFGKKPKTELCDAKYDGRINVLDVIQTKLIILGKEKELTVIDTLDRIVTVNKPIESIVTTFGGQLEIIILLNAADKVVGVDESTLNYNRDFFPEFSEVPCVGWWATPDTEVILKLHPDAVILYGASYKGIDATQDVLESAGITVFRFKCQTPEVYPGEVRKLGYILDKENEAKEFLEFYEKILNSIKEVVEKIQEEDKPKVYIESYKPYTAVTRWIYSASAGGKNIFAGEPGGSADPEAVIERDPDIIVKTAPWTAGNYDMDVGDTAELKAIREEIMSRPELQSVTAVKNERLYVISVRLLSSGKGSGTRHFIQIAYFAKWFHPELFKDMDPKALHQEYLARFRRLDIDLDEKGVFVYHPEEHPHGS
jgi:iron complex transport system substrate-binding protein